MKTFFRKVRLGYFSFSLLSVDIITDVKPGRGVPFYLPPFLVSIYIFSLKKHLFSCSSYLKSDYFILSMLSFFFFHGTKVFYFVHGHLRK